MLSKWFFMHLMATNLPVFMDWAFKTSENVPSPFLLINLYSNNSEQTKNNNTTINAQISEE